MRITVEKAREFFTHPSQRRVSVPIGRGYRVRRASDTDIPALVAMGRKFHGHISPKWPFSEAGFAQTIAAMIETQFVAVTGGGFIAGVMVENPLSENWPTAKEFLWWAEDGSGIRLRNSFRRWAIQNGAREIMWSCPAASERVARFYEKSGALTEMIYSEYLPCA